MRSTTPRTRRWAARWAAPVLLGAAAAACGGTATAEVDAGLPPGAAFRSAATAEAARYVDGQIRRTVEARPDAAFRAASAAEAERYVDLQLARAASVSS